MPSKEYKKKYTKPKLREKIKEDLKQSDKGGRPGQWSARKSQMLVQEYEKQGGGYKGKKGKSAKSLEEWTKQNWQTADGKADADGKGGIKRRYLPEDVWKELSKDEKKKAKQSKQKGEKKGNHIIAWTPAIKRAMKKLGYDKTGKKKKEPTKKELYEKAKKKNIKGRSKMSKAELKKALSEKTS